MKRNQERVPNHGAPEVANPGALKLAPNQGTPGVQRSAWTNNQLIRTSDLLR